MMIFSPPISDLIKLLSMWRLMAGGKIPPRGKWQYLRCVIHLKYTKVASRHSYLCRVVTDCLADDLDICRERRALPRQQPVALWFYVRRFAMFTKTAQLQPARLRPSSKFRAVYSGVLPFQSKSILRISNEQIYQQ